MSKIVTSYDNPPIPVRSSDWSACYDGYEESGPTGHGATEAEAIADLVDNYDPPAPINTNALRDFADTLPPLDHGYLQIVASELDHTRTERNLIKIELAALKAERDVMAEALKPFAEEGRNWLNCSQPHTICPVLAHPHDVHVYDGDEVYGLEDAAFSVADLIAAAKLSESSK